MSTIWNRLVRSGKRAGIGTIGIVKSRDAVMMLAYCKMMIFRNDDLRNDYIGCDE